MRVQLSCPFCNKSGTVPKQALRKPIRCKRCNTTFQVDPTPGGLAQSCAGRWQLRVEDLPPLPASSPAPIWSGLRLEA